MSISNIYAAEIKKGINHPNVILEVALDGGILKLGYHLDPDSFSDVMPALKSVSSLQNKLDPRTGYSSRGQMTFVISGRNNFTSVIGTKYLKNRRVTRKEGALGIAYADYATTYEGKIVDWSRKGDELTVSVQDDLVDASKKIPTENITGTQYIDFSNHNPVDIMESILTNNLGISSAKIDSANMHNERDLWLSSWKFCRVITDPKEANAYLNELQTETNSFLFHNGEKIDYKVFAPPIPGQSIEEWTTEKEILAGSFSQKSGYKDEFFNRIVVNYDYDESGGDKAENFETVEIYADTDSQSAGEWDEVSTKTINSKWIKTRTFSQTANIGGLKVYHVSRANGTGSGTLSYTASTNSLTYTAPGDAAGEPVVLSKNGKFQVLSADKTRYIRVLITVANLPGGNQSDAVTITAIDGQRQAITLAQKLLTRFRDPVSIVNFELGLTHYIWDSKFLAPTQLKTITTDEACEKGEATWSDERVMITMVRPDLESHKVAVEAMEMKMYKKYGFIAPAGYPDYGSATAEQRRYAFIGRAGDNKVNSGSVEGYSIW